MSHGNPLRWRIIAVLLTVSILPLGMVGIGSWVVFGRLLEQRAVELLESVVLGHSRSIEAYLSDRLRLLEILAHSSKEREITTDERLRELFNNLNLSSDGGFVDLGVIAADGRHLSYVGPYYLKECNYVTTDWFREVMLRGVYISDVFPGFRQVPHVIIAVKVANGGEPWILRATINSEQFDRLVSTGVPGRSGYAYIVNREGLYQTTPLNGALLDRAQVDTIEFHPGTRERLVTIAGVEKFQVTSWVNDNRWMLVVEQDAAEVREPVKRAIMSGALVVLMAVILLIITTFLATGHLTDRIDRANRGREEMFQAFQRSAKLASIGELSTGLAHEINNPLAIITAEQTNISDIVGDLNAGGDVRQAVLESVSRSRRQVERCASITRKMLQFGRKSETKLEPTDIAPRLREITTLLHTQASVRNVELIVELPDNLPKVLLDPVELEQVIVNLINNSFDALPNGGRIGILARREKERLCLTVEDNGAGIAPADLERVFEPFFTTKPVGMGTGLGLSVCYGIVQAWGGNLSAESEVGKGTRIHIDIPLPNYN